MKATRHSNNTINNNCLPKRPLKKSCIACCILVVAVMVSIVWTITSFQLVWFLQQQENQQYVDGPPSLADYSHSHRPSKSTMTTTNNNKHERVESIHRYNNSHNNSSSTTADPSNQAAPQNGNSDEIVSVSFRTTKPKRTTEWAATLPNVSATSNVAANTTKSSGSTGVSSLQLPNTRTTQRVVTIVVQLRGELGNHLSVLAHAKGLQWELQTYHLYDTAATTRLVLRHQTNTLKWATTRTHLQKCFANLATLDFEEGNTADFTNARQAQVDWMQRLSANANNSSISTNYYKNRLDRINGQVHGSHERITASDIQTSLDTFVALWKTKEEDNQPPPPTTKTKTSGIPIPFLLSKTLASHYMVNRYYHDMQDFFQYNTSSADCCGPERPYPDETVFHFRNFGAELGSNRANSMGYAELPPNQTAFELLGHLQPGDKVAITTRRRKVSKTNAYSLDDYVQAMTVRGLQVRVIEGQSALQDFCFLLETQKELIGNAQSTFVQWAGLLGNTQKRVQLYIYETAGLRQSILSPSKSKSNNVTTTTTTTTTTTLSLQDVLGYPWSHPDLKDRVTFPMFRQEGKGWTS